MSRVVVLLGPPGSGKSTIGAELVGFGFRWREWESELVERWGSLENFVAHKAEALPLLHREIREWFETGKGPAAWETTGLSDAPFLDELQRDGVCAVVRLDVSERVARSRVGSRDRGRHLTDDLDATSRIWEAFAAVVAPQRPVDLVIDTERTTAAEAAHLIATTIDISLA